MEPRVGNLVLVKSDRSLEIPTEYEIVEIQTRYIVKPVLYPKRQSSAIIRSGSGELSVENSDLTYDIKFLNNSLYSGISCSRISEIEKGRNLGKGSYGTVYEYCDSPDQCNYAVKVTKYPEDMGSKDLEFFFYNIGKMVEKSNMLSRFGLSPRIYKTVDCPEEMVVLNFMDKLPGPILADFFYDNSLTEKEVEILISAIELLHRKLEGYEYGKGHGDLHPGNIFFDGQTVRFIDFSSEKSLPWYDYIRFISFLTFYFEKYGRLDNLKLYQYIVTRFLEQAVIVGGEYSGWFKIYQDYNNKVISKSKTPEELLRSLTVLSEDILQNVKPSSIFSLGWLIRKDLENLQLE